MVGLGKYSIGVGDRFGQQAKAQLQALIIAKKEGVNITPVWNKSYREHKIINSHPEETRKEADYAVQELKWRDAYFVDADHVGLKTVDYFLDYCDFFTLDVADYIGKKASEGDISNFVELNKKYIPKLFIPGIENTFDTGIPQIEEIAGKYLLVAKEAGRIYRHIIERKEVDNIIIEVSMDETKEPQTPVEIFFILSALAIEGIPLKTIAPKFSGKFYKGVDYIGGIEEFQREFDSNLAVIRFAIEEFDLQSDLKLSIHSGSDKFNIYPVINQSIKKFNAGLHLKTAGTTWLEEVIGLAESGGKGLQLVKEIYAQAYERIEELCQPYLTVVQIIREELPSPESVGKWDGITFASTLRHDVSSSVYNPSFRQLMHIGYKIASEMGDRYIIALRDNEGIISKNVTENLFTRHIKPLFF
jgi:hypothetical protein